MKTTYSKTNFSKPLGWSLYTGSTIYQLLQCVHWVVFIHRSTIYQLLQCVPWVVFIYRFHCTSTTTVCPLGGLYIQVPLYINYYSVSLGWSLYTGSTIYQLLQCVPRVVFIYRFHCTSSTTVCPLGGTYLYTGSTVHQLRTTVCPLGGLYTQVPLYINYYNVSLGWSLYTGSTVHHLLQCVPWVVFIYRFHCTLTTTVCPVGGLYIQVPLYINYYSVSLGQSLYTGPTIRMNLKCA